MSYWQRLGKRLGMSLVEYPDKVQYFGATVPGGLHLLLKGHEWVLRPVPRYVLEVTK